MIASNWVSQVAGPSLAGTLIGAIGAPVTLALDATTYLWSALSSPGSSTGSLSLPGTRSWRSLLQEMRDGIRVLVQSPLLRAMTGSHATIVLAGYIFFLVVYPLYMIEHLGLSARGVGFVFASGGLGALAGSLVTTTIIRRAGAGPTIVWSAVLFGVFGLTVPLAALFPSVALPLVVFSEFAVGHARDLRHRIGKPAASSYAGPPPSAASPRQARGSPTDCSRSGHCSAACWVRRSARRRRC